MTVQFRIESLPKVAFFTKQCLNTAKHLFMPKYKTYIISFLLTRLHSEQSSKCVVFFLLLSTFFSIHFFLHLTPVQSLSNICRGGERAIYYKIIDKRKKRGERKRTKKKNIVDFMPHRN